MTKVNIFRYLSLQYIPRKYRKPPVSAFGQPVKRAIASVDAEDYHGGSPELAPRNLPAHLLDKRAVKLDGTWYKA